MVQPQMGLSTRACTKGFAMQWLRRTRCLGTPLAHQTQWEVQRAKWHNHDGANSVSACDPHLRSQARRGTLHDKSLFGMRRRCLGSGRRHLGKLGFARNRKLCKYVAALESDSRAQFWHQIDIIISICTSALHHQSHSEFILTT